MAVIFTEKRKKKKVKTTRSVMMTFHTNYLKTFKEGNINVTSIVIIINFCYRYNLIIKYIELKKQIEYRFFFF